METARLVLLGEPKVVDREAGVLLTDGLDGEAGDVARRDRDLVDPEVVGDGRSRLAASEVSDDLDRARIVDVARVELQRVDRRRGARPGSTKWPVIGLVNCVAPESTGEVGLAPSPVMNGASSKTTPLSAYWSPMTIPAGNSSKRMNPCSCVSPACASRKSCSNTVTVPVLIFSTGASSLAVSDTGAFSVHAGVASV
jgi:hypothetical protein